MLCSCGGLNENCYRCQGRGYHTEPTSALSRPLVNSGRRRSVQRVRCPDCGQNVRRLAKHRRTAHGNNSTLIPARDIRSWIQCPYCSVLVLHLDKHVRKKHKSEFFTKLTMDASQQRTTGIQGGSPSIVNSASEEFQLGDARLEQNLDFSKQFYTFRDGGQFGSYPSSDDYGDESSA